MYDAADLETAIEGDAVKFIYTIRLIRRITGYSFTSGNAYPVGTIGATISIQGPYDGNSGGLMSSPPLSGSYILKCADSNGVIHSSPSISYNQWDDGMRIQIMQNMDYLRGRVRMYDTWSGVVEDGWKFSYRENGMSRTVIFDGFNENPPLCTLESDPLDPIVGQNVQFITEVIRPFGATLMFEPVGLEFLYSDAQVPQVLVDVDGVPALCLNDNCGYSYVASTTELTAQTYDEGTKVLTVTGTAIPTTGLTVSFGGATCDPATESFTST